MTQLLLQLNDIKCMLCMAIVKLDTKRNACEDHTGSIKCNQYIQAYGTVQCGLPLAFVLNRS